jgi:hypothetical protein
MFDVTIFEIFPKTYFIIIPRFLKNASFCKVFLLDKMIDLQKATDKEV